MTEAIENIGDIPKLVQFNEGKKLTEVFDLAESNKDLNFTRKPRSKNKMN